MPATRSIPVQVGMEHQHVDCQVFHGRPTTSSQPIKMQYTAPTGQDSEHSCGKGPGRHTFPKLTRAVGVFGTSEINDDYRLEAGTAPDGVDFIPALEIEQGRFLAAVLRKRYIIRFQNLG